MGAEAVGREHSLGETAAQWAATHRVGVGPWDLRYREAGSGPLVVLVHGLGMSADYWFRNAPPIAAAGFRVLAPDLPGFGRTRGPADGLSVPEQAEALLRWGEAMGLGPAAYVGHSLSCQVVLELAATYPERVRGLVLMAPTGAKAKHRLLRQAWGLLRDVHRESWMLFMTVAQAYLRAGLLRVWNTWHKGAEHDPTPLLPWVRVPALVVVGTRDPVVPCSFAERLAGELPQGRLVRIPGGTHAVLFSRAGAFNRAVIDFLQTL